MSQSWCNVSSSNWVTSTTARTLSGENQVLNETVTPLAQVDTDEPWNRVVKLLVLSAVATVASVGNIFIISAVLMEDRLKKRGNVFVVNMALADLIVTGLAIPAATVGLLANLSDWRPICQIQWSAALLTCFVTAPSAAAAAADARLQIGVGSDRYLGLVTITRLAVILMLIWISSAISLSTFLLLELGPDLCQTMNQLHLSSGWNWPLPAAITGVQVLWPTLLTGILHLSTTISIRSAKCKSPPFLVLPYDGSLLRSNVAVYFMFIVCWTPFISAMGLGVSRDLPLRLYNHLEWLAMAKSCLNPVMYAVCNKYFRDAFVSLFHYCCCKTSVSFSRRVRADSLRPASDVRVHIIPGYNVYSAVAQAPHRAAAGRETTSKPMARPVKVVKMSKTTHKKSSKEVYEL